ncbi:MAG: hypothetical protein WA634_07985 [Silvibacterium sp.]
MIAVERENLFEEAVRFRNISESERGLRAEKKRFDMLPFFRSSLKRSMAGRDVAK